MRRLAAVSLAALAMAACTKPNHGKTANSVVIVVDAPYSTAPSVAQPIEKGARLAAEQLTAKGAGDYSIVRSDNRGSVALSAANIRNAARVGAAAVVTDGIGVDAGWQSVERTGLPIGIVREGGEGLIDPAVRTNVFRIAPTDRGAAFRLAEYLVPKGLRLALIHDDSPYGAAGGQSLAKAFSRNPEAVAASLAVSAAPGADPAPAVLRASQAGATALLVWTEPAALASVVKAARSTGWRVPVYASTSGEDPVVRVQLAEHPDWLDGLTFVGSRLTSEKGAAPFEAYRAAYEKRFGPNRVGVQSGGKQVVAPPDWAMYSYDFVNVVADAVRRSGQRRASPALLKAMEQTEVRGANGDERGFNRKSHEGVVDDDIFFASFKDMVWTPVRDDPLSATLLPIPQT